MSHDKPEHDPAPKIPRATSPQNSPIEQRWKATTTLRPRRGQLLQ